MPVTRRSGFTLPDLLVGMMLLAALGAILGRTFLAERRHTTGLLDRAARRSTLDQASLWLTRELETVRRAGSAADLLAVAPESLTYRAVRGVGIACLIQPDRVEVRLRDLGGWRRPQAGRDSLRLLPPRDGAAPAWVGGAVSGVRSSVCGGEPALRLETVLDSAGFAAVGSAAVPLVIHEVMQVRLYRSLGAWWLGARSLSAGEGLQPVAGPLAAGGLRIGYLDAAGRATLQPADVRQLDLRLVSGSDSARTLLRPVNLQ